VVLGPAAIVSYSAGRLSGARAATAWPGTLSEMGMVVTYNANHRRADCWSRQLTPSSPLLSKTAQTLRGF
jgi:hypothetical protein